MLSCVAIGELLLGALLGVVFGVPLGAFARPLTYKLERVGRRVTNESPLLVHVERDPSVIWAGAPDWVPFSLYFENISWLSPAPLGRDDWLEWARSHGGVDAYVTQLSVTLQAKTDVAVLVENVRVRNRTQAVTGGVILSRAVGGADLQSRHFRVDLDWGPTPLVTFEDEGDGATVPRMKIAAGDVEQFQIWAQAQSGRHEWTLELLLLVEGRRRIVAVDDGGRPFVTVGPDGLAVRVNAAGTSDWSHVDE